MSKLDDLITEALSTQDHDIIASTEEQGWFALTLGQFSGKLGWVSWVIIITQSVLFLIGVWCAVRFFGATEAVVAMKWGLSSTVLIIVAGMLKFSLMPQIQADRVLRELKRVELMILHSNSKD